MESKKEPTDEQLDALLRDVQVPSDLKSQLLRIPVSASTIGAKDESVISSKRKPALKPSPQTSWLTYVLAAGLLGIAAFAASQFLPSSDNSGQGLVATTETQAPSEHESNIEPALASQETQNLEIEMLQAEIQHLEIARLESELAALERLSENQLSDNEVESMIMALAPEFSIPLGGSEVDVRSEMARVLKDYPDTRGAILASEILKQIN